MLFGIGWGRSSPELEAFGQPSLAIPTQAAALHSGVPSRTQSVRTAIAGLLYAVGEGHRVPTFRRSGSHGAPGKSWTSRPELQAPGQLSRSNSLAWEFSRRLCLAPVPNSRRSGSHHWSTPSARRCITLPVPNFKRSGSYCWSKRRPSGNSLLVSRTPGVRAAITGEAASDRVGEVVFVPNPRRSGSHHWSMSARRRLGLTSRPELQALGQLSLAVQQKQ